MSARRWTAEDMRSVLAHDRFHREIREDEMRRAARQDLNQPELVLALRRIGAKVYHIGKPLDLLVGYRGRNILMEIKREDRAGWDSEFTQEQKVFIETWPGEIAICHTIEEAINAVVHSTQK
jgi:hypothetical protein